MSANADIEVLRKEVAARLVAVVKIQKAKARRDAEREALAERQGAVFKTLYDAGGIHRERLFEAILTPEERAVGRAMARRAAPTGKRRLRLPWISVTPRAH